ALDGDSTMTRSCVAPLPELLLAAAALRVLRTTALAAVVADLAFVGLFFSTGPSADCFLRAGTGRSLLFGEEVSTWPIGFALAGASLSLIAGCCCVRFQTRYNLPFHKLDSSPIIYRSAGCQGRQGRQPRIETSEKRGLHMAFNPFRGFRKHQKVVFAILTII